METREILQIIMAGLGSIGFALIFQLRGTKLITIGLGGALAWFIFLIGRMRGNAMIGLFLAVTVAALIAELQARIRRTPVLVMEVPLLVPLIPGGDSVPHDRIDYEKWYSDIARRVCLACAGSIYHRRRRDLCADCSDCSSKAATEQAAYGEQYRSELSGYPQ